MADKFWRLVAALLDRVPDDWGIPVAVIVAALVWLAMFKLFAII